MQKREIIMFPLKYYLLKLFLVIISTAITHINSLTQHTH